ncbi:MAG: ArsR/SmtB family transcription factor [Devosia sp.]
MSLPELYSALADPTRLRVLELLQTKSRPVHELAAAFDISRPAISRHLRVLKEAGLVQEEKLGRENVYSFQRGPLKAGAIWIEKHSTKPAAKGKAAKVGAEVAAAAAVEPAVAVVEAPMVVEAPKPKAVAKPRAARPEPRAKAPAPAMPPPAQAPQLSFFDL